MHLPVVDRNFQEDSRFHYIKCYDPYIAYAQLSKIFKNDYEIKTEYKRSISLVFTTISINPFENKRGKFNNDIPTKTKQYRNTDQNKWSL